ncbi:MAG: hypothetical protein IJT95_06120 [Abditibacteriota bacterium]|nr:hypothetical protein [Abditibacteriota bacterium]
MWVKAQKINSLISGEAETPEMTPAEGVATTLDSISDAINERPDKYGKYKDVYDAFVAEVETFIEKYSLSKAITKCRNAGSNEWRELLDRAGKLRYKIVKPMESPPRPISSHIEHAIVVAENAVSKNPDKYGKYAEELASLKADVEAFIEKYGGD